LQTVVQCIEESAVSFDEPVGFTVPSAFGSYRVLHQIGSGALGPVFRTHDPQRDRLVAVKAFRLDLPPASVARLAEALRRLVAGAPAHPAIVRLVEAGLEGTNAYLAMEYIATDTLDVACRPPMPVSLERALPILAEIAAAIDASWELGLGHGALHPRDVFVASSAGSVRLSGVGVVASLESAGLKAPVRRAYAAPERLAGADWDARADVYSLGAIAHELLSGRRPAGPGEQDGVLSNDLSPEQRVDVRRVLAAALAERPEQRFESAQALVDALAAVARNDAVVLPAALDAGVEATHAESHASIQLIEANETTGGFPSEQDAEDGPAERLIAPPPARHASFEPVRVPVADAARPVAAPAPLVADIAPPLMPASDPNADVEDIESAEPAAEEESLPADTLVVARASYAEPEREPSTLLTVDSLRAPSHDALFASAVVTPRPAFPWAAFGAVAFAGILLGAVIGYASARQSSPVGPSVPATRVAETEVKVPDESAVAPRPAASAPDAAAKAEANTSTAVPRTPVAPSTPAPQTSTPLTVRSSPAGALLVVDGHPRGETPVTVRDLTPGGHTLEVARPGFVPRTERITLGPREPERVVSVELEPGLPERGGATTSASGAGAVYVDSRPRGARVTIDGRFFGTAPMRVAEVSAGVHTVRLDLTGFQSFVSAVVVKPGEQARVTAALEERQRPNR
jgi:serine/threonine-protein kinase